MSLMSFGHLLHVLSIVLLKTTGVRKIDEANKIVLKTLEIIDYFKPKYWFIENPQTGLLKKTRLHEWSSFFLI